MKFGGHWKLLKKKKTHTHTKEILKRQKTEYQSQKTSLNRRWEFRKTQSLNTTGGHLKMD